MKWFKKKKSKKHYTQGISAELVPAKIAEPEIDPVGQEK